MRKFLAIASAVALVAVAAPGRAEAVQGGQAQTGGSYSLTVRIGDPAKGEPIWGCSAAWVAVDWALTTADCLRQSGAAPATAGDAPARTMTVNGANVLGVVLHPDRDVALLRFGRSLVAVNAPDRLPLATTPPISGETFKVSGAGRSGTEWIPRFTNRGDFTAGTVTDTGIALNPANSAGVCEGDAGGAVVRVLPVGAELVGLIGAGGQGGCYGEPVGGDRLANAVRVDDLGPWIGSWTLNSGFEARDVALTSDPAPTSSGVTGAARTISTEQAHTGTQSLLYQGTDASSTTSYAYLAAYPAANLPVTSGTVLQYWIRPQGGGNATCATVGLDFADGTHVRDLNAYSAISGPTDSTSLCGQLVPDAWNEVLTDVGGVAAGKKISRVTVDYNHAAGTGAYRGFIDDIQIANGCVARPGKACSSPVVPAYPAGTPLADPAPAAAGSTVEDFAYPDPDGTLAAAHVKLISGNGRIVSADCDTTPTGAYGYLVVRSSDESIGEDGKICLQALGGVGLLTMEIPDVYSVRSDGRNLGEGHVTTATWRELGSTTTDSGDVPLGGLLAIGIGSATPGNPPATLLQLIVKQ